MKREVLDNMPTNSGVSIFNYIRENSSSTFQDIVPTATSENILTLANILFDQSYTPQLNEFVSNLINRIGYTMVHNKVFSNPLAMFKKGSVPLGTDVQDIFTNPAIAEDYEFSNAAMAKLLTITDPDTHVAYYRRNRKDLYTVTVSREGLQGAFVSWGKFEDYISSLVNSLYNGDYIDEFRYTKELILGAYDNNKAIIETVSQPNSESNDKALVKKLRELFTRMKFPSTLYNAYSKMSGSDKPVTTWTDESRIVLIVTAKVMAEIDVEVLAAAFNMGKAEFLGRVIVVDDFGDDKILACICDEAFLQIYNNQFRFDEFYNARTMSWNFYLHAWDTFAISPFANAVILATAASKPATAVTLSNSSATVAEGATTSLTYSLTPADATSDVDVVSSDTSVFTVSLTGSNISISGVSAGTGTLTATTDNGKSDEATITVTSS
jgi:hypothetical protein